MLDNYDPRVKSFRQSRLLFVRKAHYGGKGYGNYENNIIGIDHGYADDDENRLVAITECNDPYKVTPTLNNGAVNNYRWLTGENYKNIYYHQILNGIGGQD